jgi:hypothetical protein
MVIEAGKSVTGGLIVIVDCALPLAASVTLTTAVPAVVGAV